jgi:hypothetical protein
VKPVAYAKLRTPEEDVRKIYGLLERKMTRDEVVWLRRQLAAPAPGVRNAAETVHAIKFPFWHDYLEVRDSPLVKLEFYVKGAFANPFTGAAEFRHARFSVASTGALKRILYPGDMRGGAKTRKKAPAMDARSFCRLLLDKLDERFAAIPQFDGAPPPAPGAPNWSLQLTHKNGRAHAVAYKDAYPREAELLLNALADFYDDPADLAELRGDDG